MPTFTKLPTPPTIEPHQVYEYVGKKPDKQGYRVQITNTSPDYVQADPVKNNPSYSTTIVRNGGYSYRRDTFERDWRLVLVQPIEHTTTDTVPAVPTVPNGNDASSDVYDPIGILDAIAKVGEAVIINLNHTELDGTHDMLVTPSPQLTVPDDTISDSETRQCKSCLEPRPIDNFRVHNKTGKPLGTCNRCIESKRQATRAIVKDNKASTGVPSDVPKPAKPVRPSKPANSVTMQVFGLPKQGRTYLAISTQDTPQAIAEDMLSLASRLEALNNPHDLLVLATSVRDYLLETEEAHGVAVTPSLRLHDLQATFNSVKDKVSWPVQPQV